MRRTAEERIPVWESTLTRLRAEKAGYEAAGNSAAAASHQKLIEATERDLWRYREEVRG
jgi:hypothetical protein